jgi:hypothetical protein
MPDHPTSAAGDRVVSIRTGRRYQPAAEAPQASERSDHLGRYMQGEEPDDFRHRMIVNGIAFLFVAALVIAGVWLAGTLATMRKNQDCVLSGKRGCSPVEAPATVR